jgi:hypothetical protein
MDLSPWKIQNNSKASSIIGTHVVTVVLLRLLKTLMGKLVSLLSLCFFLSAEVR